MQQETNILCLVIVKYISLQIFDTIRNEQPELFRKVHAVCVDYSAIDLGISAEDREILCDEVEVRILSIGLIL